MDVIFASGNAGKVSEMQQLLAPVGLQLKSLKDFGLSGAEETATTFVENALIKARAAAHSAQLPAIADDSGLVVRALNGEPGVYSARYAGEDGNDAANNTKLLAQLSNQEDRRAYFFCCLVFLQHPNDPTPKIAFGRWHGEILQQPQEMEVLVMTHYFTLPINVSPQPDEFDLKKPTEPSRSSLPGVTRTTSKPNLTPCLSAPGYISTTHGA